MLLLGHRREKCHVQGSFLSYNEPGNAAESSMLTYVDYGNRQSSGVSWAEGTDGQSQQKDWQRLVIEGGIITVR